MTAEIIPFILAALALLSAALHDIAFRTVPNCIPAALMVTGSVIQITNGTLVAGLMAGVFIFAGATLCWCRGWLGGGDVKLLAATAMQVSPSLEVHLLLDVALSGGILALLYLALGIVVPEPAGAPRPPGLLRRIWRAERYRISRRGPLPYASAIVAGGFLVLFKG